MMNVETKVTLYTKTPLGYDPIECVSVDYSVSENALTIECAEVDRLIARAEAAEAEVERLRKQVAQARADGANEERSLHWMRENMELTSLREQVATLTALWQQAIDADLLDDPHELGIAIATAAALLNYPRTLDGDD